MIAVGLLIGITVSMFDHRDRPEASIAFIISAAVVTVLLVGLLFLAFRSSKRPRPEVEIDYDAGVMTLRNVTFVTQFAGDRVTAVAALPFADIFRTELSEYRNSTFVEILTSRGTATITGIDGLGDLAKALDEIVRENSARDPEFSSRLQSAPRARTPWYGWLILVGTVALVIYLGWRSMYEG